MVDRMLTVSTEKLKKTLRQKQHRFGMGIVHLDFNSLEAFSFVTRTFEIMSGTTWFNGVGGWESAKRTFSRFEARLYAPYEQLAVEIIPHKSNRYSSHMTSFDTRTSWNDVIDPFDYISVLIGLAFMEARRIEQRPTTNQQSDQHDSTF